MITAAQIQLIRNANPGAVLPGIDTMTGNPYATSSLLDVTKITQNTSAPYYYSPSSNMVIVNQNGAVLSGINFGSASVEIYANNVTVKDSTFTGTTSFWAVGQFPAYSGATVTNCTFQGTTSPSSVNDWITSNLGITITDNSFLDTPADAIGIHSGVVTGNYFSGAGYEPGAHADAIYVTGSTGPTTITDNFIDATPSVDQAVNPNSALRLTNEFGNLTDVTASGNFLIGGGYTIQVTQSPNGYTISNVSLLNNDIGFGLYGPYYPTTPSLANISGSTIVDFTNPAASTQALSAYEAAGLPTANIVYGTSGGGAVSGSAPSTIVGSGYAGAHLGGGSGETNFVGGFGQQYIVGGLGANIVLYLDIGDGGDRISSFDPAKDLIDLSQIDADITTAGVQSFTFIGSAAFSGGAQVRYQLNPTNNTTTVQATLAGDVTPDFSITISGLTPLTAADFALTPAQSSAALANGAGLTYSHIATAAGAPAEYAYTNVQGRAYTSYESFSSFASGYQSVETNDLNLSSNANELVLYSPGQTITRGGGSESLQVGGGSAPLVYHPIETIDATTSGSETFAFAAGFGNETINGFMPSGASPDTVQLSTSAFSYLTASMTQAQDLAAVLAQATKTASGVTISDTHGDSLTLSGVTSSMIAANPTMLQFT